MATEWHVLYLKLTVQANVLVDRQGVTHLCDFGLSRMMVETAQNSLWITTTTHARGTVGWQSPELLSYKQGHASKTSDIWAFAMTAFVSPHLC